MIEPIEGRWWLDEGQASGVWPCEVLDVNIFGVRVRPTHEGSLYYGETIIVDHNRVYDGGFNRVRQALAARAD
jgi:hypothetical protein